MIFIPFCSVKLVQVTDMFSRWVETCTQEHWNLKFYRVAGILDIYVGGTKRWITPHPCCSYFLKSTRPNALKVHSVITPTVFIFRTLSQYIEFFIINIVPRELPHHLCPAKSKDRLINIKTQTIWISKNVLNQILCYISCKTLPLLLYFIYIIVKNISDWI